MLGALADQRDQRAMLDRQRVVERQRQRGVALRLGRQIEDLLDAAEGAQRLVDMGQWSSWASSLMDQTTATQPA